MNPRKNRKREKHKVRGVRINKTVALLVLFCLCIGGVSLVSARYIKQTETNNNSAKAKEFYFESDLLDGQTHEIIPTENNGTTASVTIRLKNYADELRYSGTEIEYTVSVTEKTNSEDGTTGNAVDTVNVAYPSVAEGEDNSKHTIAAGRKQYADVTISNLSAGKTYIVTAETSNVYQKTLTGTIKVGAPDTQVYAKVSNNTDQYIEVTVWTTDYTGQVKLTYSDIGLIPDNTDSMMSGMQSTGGTITSDNWGANTSHVFRFFKETASTAYQVTINNEAKEVTVSVAQ